MVSRCCRNWPSWLHARTSRFGSLHAQERWGGRGLPGRHRTDSAACESTRQVAVSCQVHGHHAAERQAQGPSGTQGLTLRPQHQSYGPSGRFHTTVDTSRPLELPHGTHSLKRADGRASPHTQILSLHTKLRQVAAGAGPQPEGPLGQRPNQRPDEKTLEDRHVDVDVKQATRYLSTSHHETWAKPLPALSPSSRCSCSLNTVKTCRCL